jgi:CheY-like chemotaxis protein/tetratricopeptide (TPR) repeat protein
MASAHVLVIEDNPRIGDKLIEILRGAGFEATLARDGVAGQRAFAALRPDLVLVEHLVPGIEGGRLVDRVRQVDEEVPIVVMADSGRAQTRFLQHGPGFIQGFLIKPFRVPELLAAIEGALGGRDPGPLPDATAPLTLEGVLGPDDLGRVLVTLLRRAAIGVLRLQKDGARRDVYILNGLPVFAESNLLSETFGRYLRARGTIDELQYRAVRRYMEAHGVRQGEALVALEILNNQEVYGLLRGQVRERVARCFTWDGAEYAFFEDARFLDDKLMFPMNPLALVVEGVLRRRTPQELQAWFDAHRDEEVHATDVARELGTFLDRLQRDPPLSTLLAAAPTVGALAAGMHLVEPRVAAVIEALRAAEAVVLADDPLPASATLPAGPAGEFVLESVEQLDPERDLPVVAPDPVGEQVLSRYLAARGGDHYTVLGLGRHADEQAIEAAYLEMSRAYHPDRFTDHPDPDVRMRAKEVFIKVGQAFGVLSDPRQRETYRRRLEEQATVSGQRFAAEDELNQGEARLAAGDAAGARLCFARAHAEAPGEPLFAAWLGYATFLAARDEDEREEGETLLKEAIGRDPSLDVGHELLALLYRASGRGRDAASLAERAAHLRAEISGVGLSADRTLEGT